MYFSKIFDLKCHCAILTKNAIQFNILTSCEMTFLSVTLKGTSCKNENSFTIYSFFAIF